MSGEQCLEAPKVEVRRAADGLATLCISALNEEYHSRHGMRQETANVFIRHGLLPLLPEWDERGTRIKEVFAALPAAPWDASVELLGGFRLSKQHQSLQAAALPAGRYHLIYSMPSPPKNSLICR